MTLYRQYRYLQFDKEQDIKEVEEDIKKLRDIVQNARVA